MSARRVCSSSLPACDVYWWQDETVAFRVEPEPHGRLADVVRAPDENELEPVVEHARPPAALLDVPVEEVEGRRRRGGRESRLAERQQPGVLRVERLDVLQRVERAVDLRLGNLPRDRPQDEDSAHAGIGVELADEGEHIRLLDVARQRFRDVAAAELPGDAPEAALVGVGGVVVAGQDRREAGFHPFPGEGRQLELRLLAQLAGEPGSVDHDRHVGRNIRPPHQPGPDGSGPYTWDGRTANVGAGPVRPRGRPRQPSEQAERCPVGVDVDVVEGGSHPVARHRLHVAAEGDDPAGACVGA